MVIWKENVFSHTLVVITMKETTKKENSKVKELYIMLMATYTMDNGVISKSHVNENLVL
jgi:hypothetical protein